jgi:serine/threonine protein phosphatase 1
MDDVIAFAIGDIHGCFDKLTSLLSACDSIAAGKRTRFVFVGDYVDIRHDDD